MFLKKQVLINQHPILNIAYIILSLPLPPLTHIYSQREKKKICIYIYKYIYIHIQKEKRKGFKTG